MYYSLAYTTKKSYFGLLGFLTPPYSSAQLVESHSIQIYAGSNPA
jgi:hypothetical protein